MIAGCGSGGGDGGSIPLSSQAVTGGTIQTAPLDLIGTVSTISGTDFSLPVGITTDGTNLYIADCNNNRIRRIVIKTGTVTTLAGTGELATVDDGPGTVGSFYHPRGITTDGTWLYVTEMESGRIRRVRISTGKVSTIATSSALSSPAGITTDKGNLYVTESAQNTVCKIVISSGVVTTVAGSATAGWVDGTGTDARFSQPVGITTDGSSLYVNDFGNSTIRRIVIASRIVTTVAGSPGLTGADNGIGAAARFTNPATGITTDGTNLYVSDYNRHIIRKIVISSGEVSTLAGSVAGNTDGTGAAAQFRYPEGITSDGKSLFISDSYNNVIRTLN